MLHFEAADYDTRVFVNGQLSGAHEGGYTRFSFDITELLNSDCEQQLDVHCHDDPHDLAKPRGKQDWLPEAHSIWYPRTTGLWQSVWLEVVPALHIKTLRWTPTLDDWSIAIDASLNARSPAGTRLRVELSCNGEMLADDTFSTSGAEVSRSIRLVDGGIDSAREALLWSPGRPTLIDARLTLIDAKRPCARPRRKLHGHAIGRHRRRSLSDQRPADRIAAAARPRLLDRHRPDAAERRRDRPRHQTRAVDGLQRRPQTSEDRNRTLPLLRRQNGPAGVGRNAEPVPLQWRRGPSDDHAVDGRDRT